MAENETKLINFRAGMTAQEHISGLMKLWGLKQSAVILRAIEEAFNVKSALKSDESPDVAQKTYERAGRIENMVEEVLELVQSSSVAPVAQVSAESAVPAGDAPFHPTCKHCGAVFGAWNRFASICPGCFRVGHRGDPRDCGLCNEARAL